jgi:hypothetical protein
MLILNKQKAVERMLALTTMDLDEAPEARFDASRGRAYQRVAVYERRSSAEGTQLRRAERRAGLLQPAGGAPSV